MKSVSFLSIISLSFFVSCSSENEDDRNTGISYSDELTECYATLETYVDNGLKATVERTNSSYKMSWTEHDVFKAHHEEVGMCKYGCLCEADFERIGSKAVKVASSGTMKKPDDQHVVFAYYPSSGCKEYLGDGSFRVELPDQNFRSETTIDDAMAPMACLTKTGTFSFLNVAGILRIVLKPMAGDLKQVVKSVSISSDINMSGLATVHIDKNTGIPSLEMDPVQGEPLPLKLKCGSGVELNANKSFMFIVPPYDYKYLVVTVETENNKTSYKIVPQSPFSIGRAKSLYFNKSLNLTLTPSGIKGDPNDIAD